MKVRSVLPLRAFFFRNSHMGNVDTLEELYIEINTFDEYDLP